MVLLRDGLRYISDEEMEEFKNNNLVKKEKLSVIWEIDGEQYIVVEATAQGRYVKKVKKQ